MKKKKTKQEIQEEALIAAMAATRGPATNLRPSGPMEDSRTKRLRTRSAQKNFALKEQS